MVKYLGHTMNTGGKFLNIKCLKTFIITKQHNIYDLILFVFHKLH